MGVQKQVTWKVWFCHLSFSYKTTNQSTSWANFCTEQHRFCHSIRLAYWQEWWFSLATKFPTQYHFEETKRSRFRRAPCTYVVRHKCMLHSLLEAMMTNPDKNRLVETPLRSGEPPDSRIDTYSEDHFERKHCHRGGMAFFSWYVVLMMCSFHDMYM